MCSGGRRNLTRATEVVHGRILPARMARMLAMSTRARQRARGTRHPRGRQEPGPPPEHHPANVTRLQCTQPAGLRQRAGEENPLRDPHLAKSPRGLCPVPPPRTDGTMVCRWKTQTGPPEAASGTGDVVCAGRAAGSPPRICFSLDRTSTTLRGGNGFDGRRGGITTAALMLNPKN